MKDEKAEELLKELREKMEARRKELDLEWEENERERQGGGMLIVIAFIAGIAAIAGTVIYVLTFCGFVSVCPLHKVSSYHKC